MSKNKHERLKATIYELRAITNFATLHKYYDEAASISADPIIQAALIQAAAMDRQTYIIASAFNEIVEALRSDKDKL